ncbi:uncharacterized protein LOC114306646 [Camellia sinensis]|uniref:uncharacterized protein LOC114306646 n=1 Tax=Camellia sinensis TaxID=4442 RepID=UPI001036B372|nr:uncharacterized protein LOC114306646 [Camellia sinensis]
MGLFDKLQEALVNLQLDIGDLKGQGYDNGSNMKGKNKDNLKEGLMAKSLSQTHWKSRIKSVKPLRYHASKIRDALVDLYNNPTTDSIAKSEAKSLVTHELETFEFLFSIVIWYNLLFHVNSASKLFQSGDMDITVVVKQLDGLVKYVAMYREVGFMEAMVETKEMASELGIEPTFVEKRIISRKKQFDENVSREVTQSAEESFRVDYFFYIVDQALCSLKNRFEQFKVYETSFGFLFDLKRCSDESLKAKCVNLEEFLKHGKIFDIDGRDLLMELKVLKERLSKKVNKPIEVLNHLQLMTNCFPNSWVAYRIFLAIPVTVA